MQPVTSTRTPRNTSRETTDWCSGMNPKLSAKDRHEMEDQAQESGVCFFTQRRFGLNRGSVLNMVPGDPEASKVIAQEVKTMYRA